MDDKFKLTQTSSGCLLNLKEKYQCFKPIEFMCMIMGMGMVLVPGYGHDICYRFSLQSSLCLWIQK